MKITLEHISSGENEVIIKYQPLGPEIQNLLAFLRGRLTIDRIAVQKEEERFLLLPDEVYYIEAVDNKVFVYTKDDVMESQDSLNYLESKYSDIGLIRIGKSQLVNLYHIKKLKSIINSRIEITLESGDRLVVSRHYARTFKSRLGIEN